MTTTVRACALALALLAAPSAAPAEPLPAAGLEVATLMDGPSGGVVRDALERDFVPAKRRDPGCRSYSSASGTAAGFMNSRLVTARPHATLRAGPGKQFCAVGHVVGRDLRLRIVAEEKGWFRIELGEFTGWANTSVLKREL